MYIYVLFGFLLFSFGGLAAKEVKDSDAKARFGYEFKFPDSAPQTYLEWESMEVPTDRDFRLPEKTPVGESTAPDGGRLMVQSAKNYQWELNNGSVFIQRDGDWEWKNNTHTVRSAKGSHALWESFYSVQFPDGSTVTKHKIPKTNSFQYSYKRKNRGGSFIYFDMVHPKDWGMEKTQIGVFDITYSPNWNMVVESLRENNRISEFLKYNEEQFGFHTERIKVVLHESKEKFWIYAGKDSQTKEDCTGFSNGSFFTLCPLMGIILESKGNPIYDSFLKKNYDLRAWKHDTLHYIQSQRCEQLGGSSSGLTEPWFLEGIAELAVIQTDPEHKANTYERFFQKFLRKRTSLKEGNNPKLPDYRLVGTMFLEYLSLVYGNEKIRTFYEETCFGKSTDSSFEMVFGLSMEKATTEMYDYFQKNQSGFENQFIVWRMIGKPKLQKKIRELPNHCDSTSVVVPKDPAAIIEFADIPCMMRNQVYDFSGLSGLYEGGFVGSSNKDQMESVFLLKSAAYQIQSEGQTWTIGEDEEQWDRGGVRIVNWRGSGDRQMIFPNKKRVHCFFQSKTCSKPYE